MAAIDDDLDELKTMAQGLPALIQAQEAATVASETAAAVAAAQAVTQTKVDALSTTLNDLKTSLQPPAKTITASETNDSIPSGENNDSIPAGRRHDPADLSDR